MQDAVPPQNESEKMSETPQTEKKGVSLNVILSIFILILVAVSLFFYFQNRQLKNMLTEKTSENSSISGEKPDSDSNQTQEWKTYDDKKYKFSFQYPPSWNVSVNDGLSGNYQTGSYEVKVYNEGYQIEFIGVAISGPDPCYFDDYLPPATEPSSPYITRNTYDTYKTINNPNLTIRRGLVSEYQNDNTLDKNIWNVCILNDSTNAFTNSTNIVARRETPIISQIRYITPRSNPDNSIVGHLDQILSTFGFTEPENSTPTISPKTTSSPVPASQ